MTRTSTEPIDIAALRQRQPDAIQQLVRAYTTPLLRGAMAMGFRDTDAEELVQDTFVAFLDGLDRFQGRSSIKTYLFGILNNKGAELMRHHQKEAGTEDIEAVFDAHFNAAGHWLSARPQGPEDAVLTKEIAQIIAHCSETLSPDQKTAFFLKEVDGTSQEDICNILSVSYTNLRVLLFRARLRLRECLEKNWK